MVNSANRRIAVIINSAFALTNFRGALIEEMVRRGARVYAFAPDFDDQGRATIEELGAVPISYRLDRSSTNPVRELRNAIALAKFFGHLKSTRRSIASSSPRFMGRWRHTLPRSPIAS